MKQREQVRPLLHKAAQDEALLDAILQTQHIDDDVFGFHAPQAVEKLLNAWLTPLGHDYPKTQNMRVILERRQAAGAGLPADLQEVERLTPYATLYRYEDLPVPRALDRKGVRQQIKNLRLFVEARIG